VCRCRGCFLCRYVLCACDLLIVSPRSHRQTLSVIFLDNSTGIHILSFLYHKRALLYALLRRGWLTPYPRFGPPIPTTQRPPPNSYRFYHTILLFYNSTVLQLVTYRLLYDYYTIFISNAPYFMVRASFLCFYDYQARVVDAVSVLRPANSHQPETTAAALEAPLWLGLRFFVSMIIRRGWLTLYPRSGPPIPTNQRPPLLRWKRRAPLLTG